eukprot:Amastigsp_a2020_32.p4 type:complete len:194 gc:universal Amastigsp_a2020_32:1149-568(-)
MRPHRQCGAWLRRRRSHGGVVHRDPRHQCDGRGAAELAAALDRSVAVVRSPCDYPRLLWRHLPVLGRARAPHHHRRSHRRVDPRRCAELDRHRLVARHGRRRLCGLLRAVPPRLADESRLPSGRQDDAAVAGLQVGHVPRGVRDGLREDPGSRVSVRVCRVPVGAVRSRAPLGVLGLQERRHLRRADAHLCAP